MPTSRRVGGDQGVCNAVNPSENDKYVWKYKMSDYLKSEKVLKRNLQNLYTVIISLCDMEVKNQVRALEGYREFNKKLDSMTLLKEIKKIVYTGGSDNLHVKHNKAMAHIGLWTCDKKSIKTYKTSGTCSPILNCSQSSVMQKEF